MSNPEWRELRAEAAARTAADELAQARAERERESGPDTESNEGPGVIGSLMGAVQHAKEAIVGKSQETAEKAKETKESAIQKTGETAEAAKNKLGEYKDYTAEKAKEAAEGTKQKVTQRAGETKEEAKRRLEESKEAARQKMEDLRLRGEEGKEHEERREREQSKGGILSSIGNVAGAIKEKLTGKETEERRTYEERVDSDKRYDEHGGGDDLDKEGVKAVVLVEEEVDPLGEEGVTTLPTRVDPDARRKM